jgi:hypothetical protein
MTKNQDGGKLLSPTDAEFEAMLVPSIEVTPRERILIPERIARNSRR